ncbi:Ankyrin repeat-containing protein [Flavobacterium resistens]|uniref:Ankyrin repeat domain-containing protein n=1 Tax=Flavobacterium resistens TaxID=443612 RepID=A0A521F8G8_9FLAO|nr:ankyrin repeat domain-containing protein [Flavobacterium resistens]MRX70150.1 ankyrin repeat domain-containing protein [Flavobacterium resistens]SMO91790.1 Ankyrin repeat-containing protein [Flavobacterium resistens]
MKKRVIILGAILVFGNVLNASSLKFRIKNEMAFSSNTKSPLHLAISKGDIESVKRFIQYGVDINKMVNDMTPLMIAARFNEFEIIKILLKNGATPSDKNEKGFTALNYAEYAKATESIAILKNLK